MANKIKKVGLILGLVLLVGTAGVLSINHYNEYQNKQAHESQAKAETEAANRQKEVEAAKAHEARVLEQYTQTRLSCEKGLGFYAKLTSFQKGNETAPNCGPAVIN